MVSPRRLAAALSSLSVLSMLVVVMSLPPVMKKRDRPLVGDSPARIRVSMVGTVSLGGVVAVANGRRGIPRNQVRGSRCGRPCAGQAPEIKSGAGSVVHRGTGPAPDRSREKTCATRVGLGEGGAGGGGSDPRAGCCLVERSARSSSRRKATTRGPSRALKRHVCPTGRQPLLALRQRRATLRSGPRASFSQGPQPPQAAPRDDVAEPPAHPQDRRELKRPAVAGGHQGGSPALGRDSAADGWIAPAGLRHPSHRTGRATFMASGSPLDGL